MPAPRIESIGFPKGEVLLTQLRTRPFQFRSPFAGEDFVLLLVVAARFISPEEQAELSSSIVAENCRYAVCWGHRCSSWDDSIDFAFMSTDPNFDPPDERDVMTTWHEHETLEETAWFFMWSTTFDDFVPQNFLAVVLGGSENALDAARSAIRLSASKG